jgi:hypothetical protein
MVCASCHARRSCSWWLSPTGDDGLPTICGWDPGTIVTAVPAGIAALAGIAAIIMNWIMQREQQRWQERSAKIDFMTPLHGVRLPVCARPSDSMRHEPSPTYLALESIRLALSPGQDIAGSLGKRRPEQVQSWTSEATPLAPNTAQCPCETSSSADLAGMLRVRAWQGVFTLRSHRRPASPCARPGSG